MSKERTIRNKQRPLASRIRQGLENLALAASRDHPKSYPVSPIILPENVDELVRYKAELARQCKNKNWVPDNVRVGIDALKLAHQAGIDVGPTNEILGI